MIAVDFGVPREPRFWLMSTVRVNRIPAAVPMLIRDSAIFQPPRFLYVRRKK